MPRYLLLSLALLFGTSFTLLAEEPNEPPADTPKPALPADPTQPAPSLAEILRAIDSEEGGAAKPKGVEWSLVARIVTAEGALAIIAAEQSQFTIRQGDMLLHEGQVFKVDTVSHEAVILLDSNSGNPILLR